MNRLPTSLFLSLLPWIAAACAAPSGPAPYESRDLAFAYAPAEEAPVPVATPADAKPPEPAMPAATESPTESSVPMTTEEMNARAARAPQDDGRDRRERMPWEFTLAGTGSNDKDFEAGSGGVTATVGYFFNEIIEVGLRQNLTFADADNVPSVVNGATVAAIDAHLPLDMFYPFIGANIGYVYGDSIDETFAGGPEGGVKVFLKDDIFVAATVQYEFFFDDDDAIDEAFEDGVFQYSLGLGMRF
jgi:hypothetical protein